MYFDTLAISITPGRAAGNRVFVLNIIGNRNTTGMSTTMSTFVADYSNTNVRNFVSLTARFQLIE